MKIGVPWPTGPSQKSRVNTALDLWNERDFVVCSPIEDEGLKKYNHEIFPRNSSAIGSNFPRVYLVDVLNRLREKFPNEDWYGICNSDCVPDEEIFDAEPEADILIYHRTDIPDWKFRFNRTTTSNDVMEQIYEMRCEGVSDKRIARKFNRLAVPPPDGHSEWTYVTLKELFFEQGMVYFWGTDMFLFKNHTMDSVIEFIQAKDFIFGTGGFDARLAKWCSNNFKSTRVINKLFHVTHTPEWSTRDVEYLHNGGDLGVEEKQEHLEETFLLGLSSRNAGTDAVATFTKNWTPHIVEDPLAFITTEKMVTASHMMSSFIPDDIDMIIGIARSGMIPGSVLACHLHLPLLSVSEDGVVDLGSGVRFEEAVANPRKILVIDDTVFAGRTMKRVLPVVRKHYPRADIIKATVYCTPQAKHLVDYFACELAEPHYLEWNFFNAGPCERAIFDMDGIICRDILPEDDDDGPRYLNALQNARPKYLPRRKPIPMIVTARLERYRDVTEKWLESHGVICQDLVMGPWRNLQERNEPGVVAEFKSDAYINSHYGLFVESCPIQARHIARQTRKKVLCPAAGKVFA